MNMDETKETGLTLAGVNELQSGMFGESNVKKATSLDLNNEAEADMLLNNMQNCKFKLNDCVGKVIEVVGCYATEREAESFDEETGEAVVHKNHTLMLFDVDGNGYVTGSNSCYLSFMDIVTIKGMPTKEHHLLLTPIKVNAKEKDHFYLKLQVTTKK